MNEKLISHRGTENIRRRPFDRLRAMAGQAEVKKNNSLRINGSTCIEK
jgi:hypothetical protein